VLAQRRVAHLRSGTPHVSERRRPDGRVVETRVQPMADGGMVSTFTDVTDYKKVEADLREIAETLEMRVEERVPTSCARRSWRPSRPTRARPSSSPRPATTCCSR